VLLYTLIGLVATVIMQSSHATLVLIITALASQQVTYENALALAIGSNVGTTVTAIIGAISANVNGKRLAVAHLIFNAITGLLAVGFIFQLSVLVNTVAAFLGIADDNYTLKLAVFHSIFNLLGVILLLPWTNKLVVLLTRLLPEKPAALAAPLYLNPAAIGLPETAVEVIRKETMNLYSHFFSLVCHGLSFHLSDIRSERRIKDIVEQSQKVIPVNINEKYDNNVKNLYSEIVDFSSRAQVNMSASQNEEIFRLRSAGRDMLEAIKDTKHLYKNLSLHLHDPNLYIRHEYDKIRRRLGSILRRLWEIEKDADEGGIELLSLEVMQMEVQEADQAFFTDIDKLIRDKHISGRLATSLMNDSTYANSLAHKLLDIGRVLFKTQDPDLRETQEGLMLSDQERREALETRKTVEKTREGES
ncbi:MAG: Na/Pi cotransporter family protein, partial [Gammaproteobacteria bacterium]|nr:Na/Pi cotransporter family protein [Gammaproteobacteria bacterium]